MQNKFLLTLIFFVCFLGLKSQTTIPSLITTNQVWDISGSPYLLTQNALIDSGITVIVKPGVEIKTSTSSRIDIKGEFQAQGTWDSIIKITKVRLNFTAKSRDYNSTTGRGAYFNYCEVEGNGSGSTAFELINTSVKVDHCTFTNTHFCIYILNAYPYEAAVTNLTNSKFYGIAPFNSGSPIYCNNMQSRLVVNACLFANASNIYTYGNVQLTNNIFSNIRSLEFDYMYGTNEISCNKFSKISNGVTLNVSAFDLKTNLAFNNNSMDSIGTPNQAFYNMLTLSRKASNNIIKDSIVINNNNFLTYLGTNSKIVVKGQNTTPATTDTIDFKNNYWGSNNPTIIASHIKDYSDDINTFGRVNFSGYTSSPITGCSYNNNCAIANFGYDVDDTTVTFLDSSYSSKPYRVKWKFGDGSAMDTNKIVTHQYAPGTYLVCMYTYDTLNNLCDSMCKTIHVYHSSTCYASFYFAIDTTNTNIVYVINTSTGTNPNTKYYWTFGDGTGSSAAKPTHTYNSSGKFQICVTIFDTVANCYSTFCDSVVISTGMELAVLNQGDVLKIEKGDISNSFSVYPNPSKGEFKILLQSIDANEVSMSIMNMSGQIIHSEKYSTNKGFKEINLNLSNYDNGLYCIKINSANYTKTVKLVLSK